jgi:hypothetical protein
VISQVAKAVRNINVSIIVNNSANNAIWAFEKAANNDIMF